MKTYQIVILVGSLRKESFNKKIANALSALAPENLKLKILEIGDLELYNEDLDTEPPLTWVKFRNEIQSFDGVLFVTPEYNRSVPAVLKNALDVGSRPYGKSVWKGKPAGIISASPGPMAAFGANHHLRQSLVFLNMPALQQPEAYISNVIDVFDENGQLVDKTRDFLKSFMLAYSKWVVRILND